MKTISGTRKTLLSYALAAALLGAASLAANAAADNAAVVQNAGSVTYVSGGVGLESQGQLSSMSRDFNLKLVFALNSGAYLSGVEIAIVDSKGKAVVDTTSDGPWFMVKLPAGSYRVVATVAGKSEKRQVAVAATGLKTIDFRWASE